MGNPLFPPRGILISHAPDEGLEVRRDRRASRCGLPPPEQPKSLAMPADQRGWLYHSQRLPPVEPAREPNQGETGGVSGALRLDVAFLIQRQLFAQKEI